MANVIVGVDGSTPSRVALRWAAAISSARSMRLRVVTAWEYPASIGSPVGAAQPLPAAQMDADAEEIARRVVVEELDAGADVDIDVGRGPAGSVLVERAGWPDVATLVIGARGLGGFDGLLLGSVSQQCAEHAPCPVVIVRGDRDHDAEPPRVIVAAADGSAGSDAAMRWAAALARDVDAKVVAAHVIATPPDQKVLTAARRALEEAWCEPLRALGVEHEARLEVGDARSALLGVAAGVDADLTVVGSRGLGPVAGLLLGSVAGYLVRYAPGTVAVVRPSVHTEARPAAAHQRR